MGERPLALYVFSHDEDAAERVLRETVSGGACVNACAAHGGLAGFPQVSVPGAHVDGLPVGLSILGARGSDAMLVAVARALEAAR